ncbi:helicase [Candidatus Aerophobetes bacterium]|uniref:Helicase n=1 Tax=Aerophobetes bacterium TaxID=2030807 RepID=A0A2A4X4F5_UNCAE|nr:MAG: helicase [Candidatus Aerophobetes bacterium]
MLNFRRLKQDFSSTMVEKGKTLFKEEKVLSVKIVEISEFSIRIIAKILGQYDNTYETEIEIDRLESELVDSDCDCPQSFDCEHLVAVLFHLEKHLDEILVSFSSENDIHALIEKKGISNSEKEKILNVVSEAKSKEQIKQEKEFKKQTLDDYNKAAKFLACSSFFAIEGGTYPVHSADLAILVNNVDRKAQKAQLQLVLRLHGRSKPLYVPNVELFFQSVRFSEKVVIAGKKYLFSKASFPESTYMLLKMLFNISREKCSDDKNVKYITTDLITLGFLLSKAASFIDRSKMKALCAADEQQMAVPLFFMGSLETPLCTSRFPAQIKVGLEYLHPPNSQILLNPMILIDNEELMLEEVVFLFSAVPGVLYQNVYYSLPPQITRKHLREMESMREVTVPEALFGSLVEIALPRLSKFCLVEHKNATKHFATLPMKDVLKARCDLSFLNSELEVKIIFLYKDKQVPFGASEVNMKVVESFITKEGVLARNLSEEQKMIDALFVDFVYDEAQNLFITKAEKRIIEFMTDVVPKFQDTIKFNCPQNLLDQFIYDQTQFELSLNHTDRMDVYELDLKVLGNLKNIAVDRVWDCILSGRKYLELDTNKEKGKKSSPKKMSKILVLDLEKIAKVIQLFDELGIETLTNGIYEKPLWNLANIDKGNFKDLPVKFVMTKRLKEIRNQMLGKKAITLSPVPGEVQATLRSYQKEGVHWLERLRLMYLNGILADDMGLGKTLQAIVAMTQHLKNKASPMLVICPTSLLYNWYEECGKFNPNLRSLVVDGTPAQRAKLIASLDSYNLIITSYSLLQKDVEKYAATKFSYMILDEAQHIKNRTTQNAKSTKLVKADHRLILSGTPIENSLDELWSLFDFLMPGFLGSYERFVEKYVRAGGEQQVENLAYLKKKVAPFIMRRMKVDVLDDLPAVNENTYHTQLTPVQRALYNSYAESARNELMKMVEKEGFEKVQIHVLATLTRLKQICCHPAIFAKEKAERGDSAKYDMLLELLQTLISGKHKTVIFSQYTKMLQIMRADFEKMGVRFSYLDGSSRDRMSIVNEFNTNEEISVFLVSLKAGGTGLNLVGADTVIHYDMWWNPAIESQATDRVHRIGQKRSVSVYKLVTLDTIEEKIVEMQNKKKNIVKQIVSCDDDAITKLTWEDVLELLQT